MPPSAILDPTSLDFSSVVADHEAIRRANPQRFEFALLDAVIRCDLEAGVVAGYHDIREDAWWVRAHVPGRPLFPGVLMIEAAAQLSGYLMKRYNPDVSFIAFAAVDQVKFRGTVQPPCRFVLVGRALKVRTRRFVSAVQGFVDCDMVFEAEITGMVL